mmetsp:Transcript_5348/g.15670  ORF Transcript_5348/g.15670 Transcript_5348/m.15670 type:complete len:390 (-) Transcript_5348:1850-3019(-)
MRARRRRGTQRNGGGVGCCRRGQACSPGIAPTRHTHVGSGGSCGGSRGRRARARVLRQLPVPWPSAAAAALAERQMACGPLPRRGRRPRRSPPAPPALQWLRSTATAAAPFVRALDLTRGGGSAAALVCTPLVLRVLREPRLRFECLKCYSREVRTNRRRAVSRPLRGAAGGGGGRPNRLLDEQGGGGGGGGEGSASRRLPAPCGPGAAPAPRARHGRTRRRWPRTRRCAGHSATRAIQRKARGHDNWQCRRPRPPLSSPAALANKAGAACGGRGPSPSLRCAASCSGPVDARGGGGAGAMPDVLVLTGQSRLPVTSRCRGCKACSAGRTAPWAGGGAGRDRQRVSGPPSSLACPSATSRATHESPLARPVVPRGRPSCFHLLLLAEPG